jgi:hypothetical protein
MLTASGVITRSRGVIVQEDFESKADKRMINLEMEASITSTNAHAPPPASPPAPTSGMQPTAPLVTDAPSMAVDTKEEAGIQTAPQPNSIRENKGVPPTHYDSSAFWLVQREQENGLDYNLLISPMARKTSLLFPMFRVSRRPRMSCH